MKFDETAFRQLVEAEGTEVYSATSDGGAPGYSGSAKVVRFAKHYWSFDDNGGFGGPYKTLQEALSESHLCFGEVEVEVHVKGMSASAVAELLQIDAPEGHVVGINGEEWVVNAVGELERHK